MTYWLYGCVRVTVQPEIGENGKMAEPFSVDEPQLEILERGVINVSDDFSAGEKKKTSVARVHGSRKDALSRNSVER